MRKLGESGERGIGLINPDGYVVGLDIGATAVRAAILSPLQEVDQHVTTSHGIAEVPLPEGTIVDGIVHNPAQLTRVLKRLWRSYDFGCRQVVIGISHQQTVVRAMQMPKLSREQQALALPFQAKDIIALPVHEAILDFQPLSDVENDEHLLNGLLIAAPRGPVVALVRAVEAAGLLVARVDLTAFAALRAVASFGLESEAVVDLGAQTTNVVIHHLGIPRVARTLGYGGQHLTARLAERTGVSIVEAELLKQEIGLIGANQEVVAILAEAVRPLMADIRGSIQYFSSTNGMVAPDRISLTGGGAGLPGLVAALTDDSGLPCTVVPVLQHIRRSDDREHLSAMNDDAASAVAIGLALGAAA